MTDSPKRALMEAEEWLRSAKDKLASTEDDETKAGVCCALAIHAIIRANDALTLKFMNTKGTRHDSMPHMFEKLIREGKVRREESRFVRLLERAMSDKSSADYGKGTFRYEDAKKYVGYAEDFVSMVELHI